MPELPEVETVVQGIKPHLEGAVIEKVLIRHKQLRWPIPDNLAQMLCHHPILNIKRRAKYILLTLPHGTLIIHLGMSGSLRIVLPATPVLKHDHVDLVFSTSQILRYNDPRRFGAWLWTEDNLDKHLLLRALGPEPLSSDFNTDYLWACAAKRKKTVKEFIMDGKVVVGVGNIYAAESLFQAQIHPMKAAGMLTKSDCQRLVAAIQNILQKAILQGGTTLRDFINSDGKPGYFAQDLKVYGRGGQACYSCQQSLIAVKLGQRSTVFCAHCQH